MRILTIVHRLGIGGTERTVQNFVRQFQLAGHDVAVMTTLEGGVREKILGEWSIPTYIGSKEDSQLEKALHSADQFQPEIIHIHRSGIPNEHENRILKHLKKGNRKVVETSMFGRVDHTIGGQLVDLHCHVSRWNLWQWKKWMGSEAKNKPAVFIPNPLDTDTFYRSSDEEIGKFRDGHSIPKDAFVLGRIARRDSYMWHVSNIDSFAALAKDVADAWFIGIGIPDNIEARIATYPEFVRNRIVRIPTTANDRELCTVLSSMNGFLHANPYGETFGLAPAEALLCGVPLVTVSCPLRGNGHLELMNGNESGLIAPRFSELNRIVRKFHSTTQNEHGTSTARTFVVDKYDQCRVSQVATSAMEHALNADSSFDLKKRIEADALQVTEVADSEIERLLATVDGERSRFERLAGRIVFHPTAYRLYRRLTGKIGAN